MSRGVSPISEVRIQIRMRSGQFLWARNRSASEVIDLQALFNDYWSSNKHEFTVPSQSRSPTSPFVSDREGQETFLSSEGITVIIGHWKYNYPQALLFVSLQLPIQPAI